MKRLLLVSLCAAITLQGCGGDSKSKTTPPPVVTPPTTTPPPVVTPEEVHNIQPADVADYVSNFKASFAQLNLQIDGVNFDYQMLDFYNNDDGTLMLLASFSEGVLFVNFDSDEKPVNIAINFGDINDFDAVIDMPERRLVHQTVEIEADGDSFVVSGTLVDGENIVNNVHLVINESVISAGSSSIVVEGNIATLNGDLGTLTYVQISDMLANSPSVDTVKLGAISGSVNDAINLHTARLIRAAQITTLMPADGDANSGGVDFYLAGFKRVYEKGGKLGIHSWCCVDGKGADELGKDHEAHGAQLTFVREMLGAELGPEFYFYSLEAAAHDSIHVMTEAEITKYFLTE